MSARHLLRSNSSVATKGTYYDMRNVTPSRARRSDSHSLEDEYSEPPVAVGRTLISRKTPLTQAQDREERRHPEQAKPRRADAEPRSTRRSSVPYPEEEEEENTEGERMERESLSSFVSNCSHHSARSQRSTRSATSCASIGSYGLERRRKLRPVVEAPPQGPPRWQRLHDRNAVQPTSGTDLSEYIPFKAPLTEVSNTYMRTSVVPVDDDNISQRARSERSPSDTIDSASMRRRYEQDSIRYCHVVGRPDDNSFVEFIKKPVTTSRDGSINAGYCRGSDYYMPPSVLEGNVQSSCRDPGLYNSHAVESSEHRRFMTPHYWDSGNVVHNSPKAPHRLAQGVVYADNSCTYHSDDVHRKWPEVTASSRTFHEGHSAYYPIHTAPQIHSRVFRYDAPRQDSALSSHDYTTCGARDPLSQRGVPASLTPFIPYSSYHV